jgi:hypothetical protein
MKRLRGFLDELSTLGEKNKHPSKRYASKVVSTAKKLLEAVGFRYAPLNLREEICQLTRMGLSTSLPKLKNVESFT